MYDVRFVGLYNHHKSQIYRRNFVALMPFKRKSLQNYCFFSIYANKNAIFFIFSPEMGKNR